MLYRKAFKLDSRVNELYKNKHHPPVAAITKPVMPPSDATTTTTSTPAQAEVRTSSIRELMDAFSQLSIPPAEPETDLSPPPPCPIASIPGEILSEVFLSLAIKDIASFARLAQVCKRFAYLVVTSDQVWKRIALGSEIGFGAMQYRYACDVTGHPIPPPSPTLDTPLQAPQPLAPLPRDLTPTVYPSYRSQFRHRPRIRFNGCYISTVNYSRPGASNESRFTWINPVQIVTYYRYLRFFRDGTVISLLTTSEPANVVHHLSKENVHNHHSAGSSLPTAVMKDALPGRWRLSGPLPPSQRDDARDRDSTKGPGEYTHEPFPLDPLTSLPIEEEEAEGDLLIETEGVRPKYMWKMQFAIGSAGRKEGSRNTRLTWKGFWSYNRLTDDWGEFGLKNDRGYVFSRVRSYGG